MFNADLASPISSPKTTHFTYSAVLHPHKKQLCHGTETYEEECILLLINIELESVAGLAQRRLA